MAKWIAPMPRKPADDGNANVVLAFKRDTGGRAEFSGQLRKEDADKLMQTAIEMMKNTKATA